MKTGFNHAVRVTVAALSIVLGLGAAVPAAAQCPADVTGNGLVNGADLGLVLSAWGSDGTDESGSDVNQDGIVNGADLGYLLSSWGTCPDGTVRAWGYNGYGQCNVPSNLGPCSAVAGGIFHTIALRTDGTVRAWGDNGSGQCDVPANLGPCSAVAGGYYHTIVVPLGPAAP
jgi:hypothetical protein